MGTAAYVPAMARRTPTLADLGESALIERIARRAGRPAAAWALGIGDDAAILRPKQGEELVFSADAQIEGVHFRLGRETARGIGRRALAVNLSDLAAMGSEPVGALLSLAAPATAKVSVFDAVIAGFAQEGRAYGCPLVGGNLSRADVWSLHVTVIGRSRIGGALRRQGLRQGDELFVTGTLGGATLARLRADKRKGALRRVPTPRVAAGQALARLTGTRACIDLSDGLTADLGHLLAADGKGAQIDAAELPRARGFDRECRALGLDPLQVVALGGEDYELLFAFRSEQNRDETTRLTRALGVPVTRIGVITDEKEIRGLPAVTSGHHF